MNELVILLCLPHAGMLGAPFPGSVLRRCIECRGDVWVSPASAHELDQGAVALCLLCAEHALPMREIEAEAVSQAELSQLQGEP